MLIRLNIPLLILLAAVTVSALYVVDLRTRVRRDIDAVGKAQEEEIRLKQDYADLQYEHSRLIDKNLVREAAGKLKMRPPAKQEIVVLR